MATDWSEEAKARRSASARKAARTRARNKTFAELDKPIPPILVYPYIQNSRVARWALSGVSLHAIFLALAPITLRG